MLGAGEGEVGVAREKADLRLHQHAPVGLIVTRRATFRKASGHQSCRADRVAVGTDVDGHL